MLNFKWSKAEKKIERRAFDSALKKECAAVMEKLKGLAVTAEKPEDIWAIHDYLTDQRKVIDEKHDYRYSKLIILFGRLLREKWIEDNDLEGLNEEKLQAIHHITSLRSKAP
jgi:hypothetical protein